MITQRKPRRRCHLGLFACFAGFYAGAQFAALFHAAAAAGAFALS